MGLGEVPADWRQRRLAVKVRFPAGGRFPRGAVFLDVEAAVTRLIGQWANDSTNAEGGPVFAGVRYLSRLDTSWECWAVFDDVEMGRSNDSRSSPKTPP